MRLQDELATARSGSGSPSSSARPSDRVAQLQSRAGLPAAARATAKPARMRIRELERADSRHPPADRRLSEPRRIGADGRAAARLAAARLRPREAAVRRTSRRSCTRRASPRTSSATARGEQFSVLYPAAYPAEPTKPVPLRVMLIAIVGGLCLGGGVDARPRVPRPLGSRRPRAARRVRAAGARRSDRIKAA